MDVAGAVVVDPVRGTASKAIPFTVVKNAPGGNCWVGLSSEARSVTATRFPRKKSNSRFDDTKTSKLLVVVVTTASVDVIVASQ